MAAADEPGRDGEENDGQGSQDGQRGGGETPPPPPQPPTSPPPPPPPSPLPKPPPRDPYPDVPRARAGARDVVGVDLRVSKRLLWVGEAYYPLQNVARVHTLTIHPRRKEAIVLFVKRVLAILACLVVLGLLAALIDAASVIGDEDGGGGAGVSALVVIAAVGSFVYCLVELLNVLGAPSYYVLAVETNGPSHALVTSSSTEGLRALALRIAEAIENPRAEFEVRVDKISISPRHYHYGDSVNMYGGNGNVGIAN